MFTKGPPVESKQASSQNSIWSSSRRPISRQNQEWRESLTPLGAVGMGRKLEHWLARHKSSHHKASGSLSPPTGASGSGEGAILCKWGVWMRIPGKEQSLQGLTDRTTALRRDWNAEKVITWSWASSSHPEQPFFAWYVLCLNWYLVTNKKPFRIY